MNDIENVVELIRGLEEEFCMTMRDNYACWPGVCGIAANVLMVYLKKIVMDKHKIDIDDIADVCTGEYRWDEYTIGHQWIQIGSLMIDPTYEQFDIAYKNKIRIASDTKYRLESTNKTIKHYKKIMNLVVVNDSASVLVGYINMCGDTDKKEHIGTQ